MDERKANKLGVFLTGVLAVCPRGALACEFVNGGNAVADAYLKTTYYLMGSALISIVLLVLEVRSRRNPLVITFAIASIALHPRWTVPAVYGLDCSFLNVEASQALFGFGFALLAIRVISFLRGMRKR